MSTNTSYTDPILLTTTWTYTFHDPCCCESTLHAWQLSPYAFLANYSADALAANGGELLNVTGYGQGYEATPTNFTGGPLLPGQLSRCNCSLAQFGLRDYQTPTVNYTALNFQCANTTYVEPYIAPPVNLTYATLMKLALIDLNFTTTTAGQQWNWLDRSAKKGVPPSLGTALFGYHQKLSIDLLNNAPDIAPFYTPSKLRTGVEEYSLAGQAPGTQCLFQTAMMLGPKFSSGFSASIWMTVDVRRAGGTMPLMYLTIDGCFYTHHFTFALDANYVPYIQGPNGACSMGANPPSAGIALPLTQWLHISWTLELNGHVRWYYNGHFVPSQCAPMPLNSDGFTRGWLGVGDPLDTFGPDYSVRDRFYGEIAEFTMWNRTLTAEHHEMLHRWVEPAALQQRWPLRFTGLPTHKMLLPSGHSSQWVNFTLPWSYIPAYPLVDHYNISYANRTVWYNTTVLTNVTSSWNVSAGYDVNGTELWSTGTSWKLVPNITLHSMVVVDNTTTRVPDPEFRDNPAYWNLTFIEFPLVIGVNVTDERVLLSSERQWVFDLASNWQQTFWSTGILLSMPSNISSFNITFYTISGNDTFLDLPHTITFHNADWYSIVADRLFEHKFGYAYYPLLPADGAAAASSPTWNPKNEGGMMMVDGFQASFYDISALPSGTTANLGGQQLPTTWNSYDAGWTFHAWFNHTFLIAETDLLQLNFAGSHPFASRTVVQGGNMRVTLSPTQICVFDNAWYGGFPTTNTGQGYSSWAGALYCTGKLAASIPMHQWWMLTLTLSRDGILNIYQNAILIGTMDTDHQAFMLVPPYSGNSDMTFGGPLRGCGNFAPYLGACSSGRANIVSMGHYSIYEWEFITPEVEVVFENPPPHLWRNNANQFWVAETVPMSLAGGANWTATFWPGGLFMPNLTDVGTAWINMSVRCRPATCLLPLYPNDMVNLSWAVDPVRGAQPQSVLFILPGGASELVIEFELFGDVPHHAPPDTIVIPVMTLDLLVNRSNSNLTTLTAPYTIPSPGWTGITAPFTDLVNAAHGFTDITNAFINPAYTNGMLSFISNWDKRISIFQPADGLQSPPNSHGLTVAMDHTINTWKTGFTIAIWVYQFIPQGGPIFQTGRGDNLVDNVRFDIGTGFSFWLSHFGTGLTGGSMSRWRTLTHQWYMIAFATDKQYNVWLHQHQSNILNTEAFNIGGPLNIIPRWSNTLGHLTLIDTTYVSPHLAGLNGMLAQVLYYNNSLSANEVELLASYPPPALSAGCHQLFMLRPLPRMLPQSYNFTSLIRLPHLLGEAVTLHIESNPPGFVFPTEMSWIPKSKLPSQSGDQLLTISMINSTDIASIDIRFWVSGDFQHYAAPDNGTIWTYMLEPHLILDYSYQMLISEASFNLNCSWNVTAALGGHAAKDPLMPDVIWFNGLNHWLDLSVTADTGLTYPVSPRIFDFDVSHGFPHLYTKGWSMSTWVQFHEFSRDNPIVGCGPSAPSPMSDGFSLKILNNFPVSPPSLSNFQVQFIMGNSYELTSYPSCAMTVSPTPNMYIYSWNHYAITMDSYAIVRLYQNGVMLGSVQCQFPLPKTRDQCWAGRSFTNEYYMTGRMAALQFYPRALADGEINALSRTLIRPMWQTPFQFPPWTPPPFLLNGLTIPIEMYPPHSVGGVRICASTYPPGMVQPNNLTWTTANGIAPQSWKLTMPLNIPLLNLSFTVCENLHPFPLWSVPPVAIVQNLTFTRLYAEAPQKITMNAPSEHGVWQANLRLLPNLGTLITSIVPAGGSYLDINDPNDVAPNSIVPVDPWRIPVNKGLSLSMWLIINSESGTIFQFERMGLRILNEQQLELYIYDTSSTHDGYCYIYAYGATSSNYWYGSGATAMDTFVIDEWFHLLIHWDHWTGYVRLWTNGYLKLESRCSRGSTTIPWAPTWFAGSGLSGLNSYDGQMGDFYMWPRALWPWEVQLLAEATPKNIIPVKFRVKLVNNTALPLALGWDTNAYMQYQMYLSFGTHPTLIPSWQCAQFPQYPCQTGDLQVLEPGRGLRYDMVDYFKTRWLIFRMNPGVFGNQKYSGHVPEITLSFDIVNDTLNYVTPPPVTYGIPKLMNNTVRKQAVTQQRSGRADETA